MTLGLPIVLTAAVAGLALGSFATTAGLRMAQGDSALRGRSRCDHCGQGLSFAHTIPIVSSLQLRGRCAACDGRIDQTHMVGETTGALICAAAIAATTPLRALAVAVLGLTLLAAATSDWKTQRLPDVLTGVVAVIAGGLALADGPSSLVIGGAAALLLMASLQAVRFWSRRGGRPVGLGLGDVKLAGALALWLGFSTPWMILLASLIGLAIMAIARPSDGRLAFGPALAIAAMIIGLGAEGGLWPTTV